MAYTRRSNFKRKPKMKRRPRRVFRKKPAYPARFAASKYKYNQGKMLAKMLSQVSETKLLACTPFNELAPLAIQTGAITTYRGFVVNTLPTSWDSNLNQLGGIVSLRDLTGSGHIGNYVYYKKTHLTFQIDMGFTVTARPPVQFRCVVCKARQYGTPAGGTDPPQTTLFLSSTGQNIGYQTSGVTGMDIMTNPLNKRDWVIRSDRKFYLSQPMRTDSDGGYAGYSGKYPCRS